ncbi:hypothetical protein P0972_010260, partial [Xanthomonas hortorum pv. gardneri]|uniref:hypothetical protein n=1 Tax=Xanthomonas hortorum TaxID=56454 RepID=UPI003F20A130
FFAGGGTVWRRGFRHRAYMDVLAACPASGEGAAPSTNRVSMQGCKQCMQHCFKQDQIGESGNTEW